MCHVTAFLDLARDSWTTFSRSFEKYFENFTRIVSSVSSNGGSMIVFIDEKHHQRVHNLTKNNQRVLVIPIDDVFMRKNIWAWGLLENESKIMSSTQYKTLMRDRLRFPEHNNPKYTLINHAKIDFVCLASTITSADVLCWVDFGYEKFPDSSIDLDAHDLTKVNYNVINPIDGRDSDVMYTMLNAPEKVGGYFFMGSRDTLRRYQELYHSKLEEMQALNLADDDQHLVLRCYFSDPTLFKFHHRGWHNIMCRENIKPNIIFLINEPDISYQGGH
jgi:hypothetical protein